MVLLKKIISRTKDKFSSAFRGLYNGILYDRSIIIQFILGLLAVLFFAFYGATWIEWLFILSAVFLVLVTEFMNSAIEDTCDLLVQRYNLQVKEIKEISSAGVLLSAGYALIVGLIIIMRRVL